MHSCNHKIQRHFPNKHQLISHPTPAFLSPSTHPLGNAEAQRSYFWNLEIPRIIYSCTRILISQVWHFNTSQSGSWFLFSVTECEGTHFQTRNYPYIGVVGLTLKFMVNCHKVIIAEFNDSFIHSSKAWRHIEIAPQNDSVQIWYETLLMEQILLACWLHGPIIEFVNGKSVNYIFVTINEHYRNKVGLYK